MPVNLDLVRQRRIDQAAADLEAQIAAPATAGDYGRALLAGFADIPTALGEGISLLGLEEAGGAIRGLGQDAQDYWVSGMTPGGYRAVTAPILESDTPTSTVGLKLLQTLPGVLAIGGAGGLAVKGIGAAGKAAGIASLAPKVVAPGVTAPSFAATGLGFGGAEGVYSGLSGAAQTRSEIMTQDIETLGQNPIYQKHYGATDPALAEESRQTLAREAASREAELDVFTNTTLTTGLISGLTGGGIFRALASPARSAPLAAAAKGAALEGGQEAPQSYLEQVHQNVALNRPATEGALDAGIEGGIIGGILGGGIGGLSAGFSAGPTPVGTTQAEIDARNVPPLSTPPPSAPGARDLVPTVLHLGSDGAPAGASTAGPSSPPPLLLGFGMEGELLDPLRPDLRGLSAPIRGDIEGQVVPPPAGLLPAPTLAVPAPPAPPAPEGPPRSSDPKLPKSFRGKTAAEFEAELSVSTLSPKTLARAEEYLNTTLIPAADRHAAAVAARPERLPPLGDLPSPPPDPVVAQPAAPSEPQAPAPAAPPSAPEYVAERHRARYETLRAEGAAETSLRANYSATDGFDAEEVRNDIAASRLGQTTFDEQLDALAAKPRRGRPTKERQAERAAASAATEGVISDPDPEIQENARAIAADPAKLAQLRQMATEAEVHPTVARLKRAVDELTSTSRVVVAQADAFARPEALGPANVAQEDLPAWSQHISEFREVGMPAPEARALLASHYDPFVGFDTATLAAIREERAKAHNPRLAQIRRAAARVQGKAAPTKRDAELAHLVAEQESDAAGELDFATLRFSRGLSPRASAQKLADVQAVVDRLVKQWRRPPFGGVQVHETIASLPRALQQEVYSHTTQNDVRGVYDVETRTVHLIASHLTTPEEAEFVLFHEVLGHFGLRGFLGANLGATMRDLYRLNPTLRKAAIAIRRAFPEYDLETATEEALADMAGLNLPLKGLALLRGKVQKALRKLGFKLTAKWLEKRTNAEVLTVLSQARAFVTAGKGPHLYTAAESRAMYSYGGARAAQASQSARSAAEQFADLGIPMEQIRATTGWFRSDLDGKWKFEISDTGVTLKPDVDNAKTIGDLIDHPTLFANYPQLRSVEIRWKDWEKAERAGISREGRLLINSNLPDSQLPSVVLHEMQHLVQAIEGFARGGSPTSPEVVEAAAQAGGTPEALFEMYQNLAGEIEARDVQARALMTDEERATNAPYTSEPRSGKPVLRFSRSGTPGVDDMAADIGEFYNFSAPFQRAWQKLAGWGSKSGAARSLRLALDRRVTSPYHIAASGRSAGYTNLFQNVLRPMQQFSDYLISTMVEPIQRTWIQGQGLGQPPAEFEQAARALFAHNDAGVPTAEFFGNPQRAANLTPKARELYDQIREVIKRGFMAEFTAKAVRMREVLPDPAIYNQALNELYALTQQRIDRGFIPNKRHGEFAIGVYHTSAQATDAAGRVALNGQPMQWYTFESIGEAKAAAQELRTLFQGQTDIVLDIDSVGQGEPLTVERAANDRYSTSSYWDFLALADQAGVALSLEEKGRLAKLMIQSESALQNKIQRRKGVAGYSKDLMRTIGEFVTSTGFSAAQTTMSARVVNAMNRRADLTTEEAAERDALRARFQDLAGVSESRVYEQLSAEPDLTKRFEALTAYSRMKFLEVSGKQFWSQDGADTGYYRDRANELIKFLKEPKSSWADKYRTLASLHFLGGSVAAATVNLSSLPMFAAPYLHQFAGARAYSSLTKHFMRFTKHPALRDLSRLTAALDPQARASGSAAKDWADLQPLGEDLLKAVHRASEEGIISSSQLYEMFGLARGGMLARSSGVRKATELWMTPFRVTEQANRFSTFMAAFEIGRDVKQLSGAALYDFARDAVDQTQGIYDPINRQPWARTPIGHALFTFRTFPLMMVELIRRLPGTQRTLVLGSLLLAAGINGLPFADDIRDIIDTIAQRVFGEPLNTRRLMTNMVAQASEAMVGADLSKLVMNGTLDAMTGASISGRIGLGNLIPGSRIGAAGEDIWSRTMADVLGPVGAEAANFAKAFQGQPAALVPTAIKNLGRGIEAARYGKITDAKGQTLIDDVSPIETFLQGLGFTSGRLSQAYEEQRGVFSERAYVEEVREGFYTRIREAAAHGDKAAVTEVGEEVRAWNEGHPQWPIAIRPQQIRSTLKLAGLPLNERTLKMLPLAWRQGQ